MSVSFNENSFLETQKLLMLDCDNNTNLKETQQKKT